MAVQWRQVCYGMMVGNAVLMLATLAVAAVGFTQPRVPPSSCAPDLGRTTARAGVSSLACPSTAESDVMQLTREMIQQAVEERQKNYHAAERFRTKQPQDLKPHVLLMLKHSQNCTRDQNLLWDINQNQSTLRGFECDHSGYLRVPEDGYYFIYAHLSYENKPGNGFDRDRLKDYIFRTEKRFVDDLNLREKLKKKLLFNEQTPCKVVPKTKPQPTTHHGAVVYLRRDDMLSVASNLPGNHVIDATRCYFGLSLV